MGVEHAPSEPHSSFWSTSILWRITDRVNLCDRFSNSNFVCTLDGVDLGWNFRCTSLIFFFFFSFRIILIERLRSDIKPQEYIRSDNWMIETAMQLNNKIEADFIQWLTKPDSYKSYRIISSNPFWLLLQLHEINIRPDAILNFY